MIGDGYCDDVVNTPECNYDNGDCCGGNTQLCSACICFGQACQIECSQMCSSGLEADSTCMNQCLERRYIDGIECKLCNDYCNGCSGSTADCCDECKYTKDGDFCVEKCPITKYDDNGICKPCDETCKGCSGPEPEDCIACKNVKDGSYCIEECPVGKFDHNGICVPCNENCNGGCTGLGADSCNSCINFKDESFCVKECPNTKYEHNGECKSCHETCLDSCNGPNNTVGINGCHQCKYVKDENTCLKKCPDSKYHNNTNGECEFCHEDCIGCTGKHPDECIQCKNVLVGQFCMENCPITKYNDSGICKDCHQYCVDACYGPGPDSCVECKNETFKENDECKPCHENCINGCNGPDNTIGITGCRSCEKVVLYDKTDSLTIDGCLKITENCPDGYSNSGFIELENNLKNLTSLQEIKTMCIPESDVSALGLSDCTVSEIGLPCWVVITVAVCSFLIIGFSVLLILLHSKKKSLNSSSIVELSKENLNDTPQAPNNIISPNGCNNPNFEKNEHDIKHEDEKILKTSSNDTISHKSTEHNAHNDPIYVDQGHKPSNNSPDSLISDQIELDDILQNLKDLDFGNPT